LRLRVGVHGLTIRAIGHDGRPHLSVELSRLLVAPKPVAAAPAAPVVATPAPAPAPPPPPAPPAVPQPPGPGSPYTNLVWSEDFTQTWASEGGTGSASEPLSSSWHLDHSGGCGGASPEEAT